MQKEPENCPGTASQSAGKEDACAGCPNQPICATSTPTIDPDIALIASKLKHVKHKLLVLSGKGGVGKSTFSATLSHALSASARVALVDIDICGPSIPRMTATENESVHMSNMGWEPVSVSDTLTVMSVAFLLPNADDAVIWRGPKKNGLIKQFLKDVDWQGDDIHNAPEFLVFDTPPGTSDEHLSLVQFLKDTGHHISFLLISGITGAILITTPQEVALQDVRKEANFCKKVGLPILGVVENMSKFNCAHCKKDSFIFEANTGGAEKMCEELGVKMLGSIPIDPHIAQCCDYGVSYLDEYPDTPAALAYLDIIKQIKSAL